MTMYTRHTAWPCIQDTLHDHGMDCILLLPCKYLTWDWSLPLSATYHQSCTSEWYLDHLHPQIV